MNDFIEVDIKNEITSAIGRARTNVVLMVLSRMYNTKKITFAQAISIGCDMGILKHE